MRIALVNPLARRMQGYHTIGTDIPNLGLQVLTRLTPPEHKVDIIDEIFGVDPTPDLLQRGRYDLVGITSYTSTATRAYELAATCRQSGIRCIMGGPHASAMPQEAMEQFDSVAVGECDELWADILSDAAAGRLARRYDGRLADLSKGYGRADQSAQAINGKYDVGCIQTSRGCPCGCDFCSVTTFNGATIRRRPIPEVVDEWNSTTKKFLFVVDDNLLGVGPKDAEWARAYAEINDFEARLAETGMVVLKLWINISKEEQLRRFQAREISPHKRHKMTKEDYRNRKKWDDNLRAAEDMIARTDTPHAPWVVVSGDDKRYARVAALKAVCRALSDRLD